MAIKLLGLVTIGLTTALGGCSAEPGDPTDSAETATIQNAIGEDGCLFVPPHFTFAVNPLSNAVNKVPPYHGHPTECPNQFVVDSPRRNSGPPVEFWIHYQGIVPAPGSGVPCNATWLGGMLYEHSVGDFFFHEELEVPFNFGTTKPDGTCKAPASIRLLPPDYSNAEDYRVTATAGVVFTYQTVQVQRLQTF